MIGIAVLVAAVILFLVFTRIYTNVLWYQSIDFSGIYSTLIATKIGLFVAGAVLLGGAVLLSMAIARRVSPQVVPNTPDQQMLARYRRGFEPHQWKIALVIAGIIGLVGGLSADGQWRTVLGFLNRTPFGQDDPQFGMDASFYVFTYPFLRLGLGYLFAAVVVAFLAAAATHYLFGGIRVAGRGAQLSTGARAHLSIVAGLFMVLKAVDYWLDRYGLVNSERGMTGSGQTQGASYTDVHAVLPAKTILAAIALLCALLFVISAVRRGLLFAGLGVGMLVLSVILVGFAYPAVVERFQVKPNQEARERPYIERNIKATRTAYDLADTDVKPYNARRNVTQDQTGEGDNTEDIRMVDPNVVSKTFQQLQQIRSFYSFSEALDVDRYGIDGEEETSIAAVRELPAPPEGRRGNWVPDHLQYTHGYGFVAADGSQVDDEGKPIWQSKDIPPKGELGKFEPRIYFGEKVPDYSIVGAPKGTKPIEFDYSSGEGGAGQKQTTYDGDGGVQIGSFWKRLLYAIEMGDYNILFSSDINEESEILYDRTPRERVQKAAPFLELDGDPYPAVVDGKIQWIVDGYTMTNNYPYSERVGLDEATEDSLTSTSARSRLPSEQINYIRNSVKATVDAYTGEVTLYSWDDKDPILKTWQKAFGNKVKPMSEMSDEVRKHVRYPADMFKAQREMLSRYHVTNPSSFYGGQEYWQIPNDPTAGDAKVAQPPYYLKTRMPGDDEARFSLTSTFVPKGRPNMAGFVSVSSDPEKQYGKLRLLKLPSNTSVPGPGTMQGQFEAYAPAAQELALLRRGGSTVRFGNLLTLPFGGGLLYVEPVYVQAKAGESYPLLQKVLVSFGGKIGYANTLDEAMDQVLGGESKGDDSDDGDTGDQGNQGDNRDVRAQLAEALQEARDAYEDGQQALEDGDFAAYGQAQKRLKTALDKAERLRRQLGTSSPRPTPSPGGTGNSRSEPSASPSGSSPSPSRSP